MYCKVLPACNLYYGKKEIMLMESKCKYWAVILCNYGGLVTDWEQWRDYE
jgi:hypothetical protein